MTVPTRPPGEQTSVSVRNATGVRGNAYAAKLGWQAKAVATFAQHTLKWKVRRPAALAWVSIIEAGLFAAASCTSIRRNRKACWVPADEPSWSAITARAPSGTRWPCAAACRGSQEISWDSLAHRRSAQAGWCGPTRRSKTSPIAGPGWRDRQREVGLDLVAIAAAVPLLDDVAGRGQVGDDAVSAALGDAQRWPRCRAVARPGRARCTAAPGRGWSGNPSSPPLRSYISRNILLVFGFECSVRADTRETAAGARGTRVHHGTGDGLNGPVLLLRK